MPWLAVYGDSLSRGVFFDTVAAFNNSAWTNPAVVHPGHYANYSQDCTLVESRPPTMRPKCGGFVFDGQLHGSGPVRPVKPMRPNDAAPPLDGHLLRFSFRLKTFTWEPDFDLPWLDALRRARRLPDVLLLSSGIWDMQYPPDNDPQRGALAFLAALRKFLDALDDALRSPHAAVSGGSEGDAGGGQRRARPRVFWLTVTAVSAAKLPSWKRPRMTLERARQYNALAAPELSKHGVELIDTFTSGAAHPELSADGVHFPGLLSRHHSELVWEALCPGSGRDAGGPSTAVPRGARGARRRWRMRHGGAAGRSRASASESNQ